MPHIDTKTSTGRTSWHYEISTPSVTNATEIEPNIPTILFFHGPFVNKEIFQLQWQDPSVRRCNCVAFDLMGHGKTKYEVPPTSYDADNFVEDIVAVMNALKLPACHVVAISMGTIGAIPLAMLHPDLVLSLFLISPLGLEEPPEVAEGREEILECWKEGLQRDETALEDAVYGALQLAFSNIPDTLAMALVARGCPPALTNWGPGRFDFYETATVKIFTERKSYTQEQLAKIKCPVQLVHCMEDIPYPLEYSQRFYEALQEAGVKVSFMAVSNAPHLGCAVPAGAEVINPLLHDFVFANSTGDIPPAPASITSPWTKKLMAVGWMQDSDDDNSGEGVV